MVRRDEVKVLIPQDVAEDGKQFLRDNGYQVQVGSGHDPETVKAEVADCDALLARTADFGADIIEAGPNLKVISRHGVGFDNIDIARAEELGIWVTNTPEALSTTVAEHAIGLMIAVGRGYVLLDRAMRSGDFDIRNRMKGVDIEGKTLGLVGLGRIGRAVAKRASLGLGMQVIAFDPYAKADEKGIEFISNLEDLLKRSDFVSLHVPATPETVGLINAERLSLMKPTAYLINTARGPIVDEPALIAALDDGTIAGAAIDVYDPEPPEADNPLFKMENTVVMPHVASLTEECMARMALHSAQGIHEVLSGKTPTWPVNNPAQPK